MTVKNTRKKYAFGLAVLLLLYITAVHIGFEYIGIGGLGTLMVAASKLGFQEAETYMPIALSLAYIQLFLPTICLIIALLRDLPQRASRFTRVAKYLSLASAIITVLDFFPMTFASGPSFKVYILVLVSAFFLQILVFSLSRQLAKAPNSSLVITPIRSIACASVLFTILFSVTSAAAVVVQAIGIADGRPYCIAMADKDKTAQQWTTRGYSRIKSWEVLRGSRFSTTSTGFKSTSKWYYHAVLIVGGKSGEREYWNWSIGKLTFHKINNAGLKIISPNGCQLEDRFFPNLPLI